MKFGLRRNVCQYVLEFRDEHELDDVMNKMAKAKKSIMEACQALEEADSMKERNHYNMNYRRGMYRDDMDYRGGRYY